MALLALATLATLAVQYQVSDQAVGTEFFKAHKTIAHTGELLRRARSSAASLLLALLLGVALWALRLTHRIVRPVHTLHRALDALVAGDLGVRVELHEGDEFHEVGAALNQLVDEFGTTLAKVHALVDRIAGHTGAGPADRAIGSEVPGLVERARPDHGLLPTRAAPHLP